MERIFSSRRLPQNVFLCCIPLQKAIGTSVTSQDEGLRRLVNIMAERFLKGSDDKRDKIREMTSGDWKKVRDGQGSNMILPISTLAIIGMHYSSVEILTEGRPREWHSGNSMLEIVLSRAGGLALLNVHDGRREIEFCPVNWLRGRKCWIIVWMLEQDNAHLAPSVIILELM